MKRDQLRFVDVETCERLSTEKYGPAPEGKPHALRPAMATVALVTIGAADIDGQLICGTFVNLEAFGCEAIPVSQTLNQWIVWCPNEEALFYRMGIGKDAEGFGLVTFNGRRFDVPVLTLGFARHGYQIPKTLARAYSESRYKPVFNLDLFDRLTGFQATSASLSEFSRAFGIEDPKAHGEGGMFEDLCNPEGLEAAIRYNRGDVVATYKLWLKWTAAQ